MKLNNYFIFVYFLSDFAISKSDSSCDKSNVALNEGNIGENGNLPWLGVLRVHIHKGTLFQTAVTGILLVKTNFAIANSGDVNRVSKHVLKTDSKAMFITTNKTPVYYRIHDVMTHPEYEFETYNSIALLELIVNIFHDKNRNLKPICWPNYMYNTSTNLYALGYTDENKLLEKVVFKMQYVTRPLCEEFYNRANLAQESLPQYQCGFAMYNTKNCDWENGMVFASNSTGTWTLIGFGLRGPSCRGPVRFLDIYPYLNWFTAATDLIIARYEK
ncbi:uncharacterized protein LOC123710581 isoform X2 [Pieris brassicae]|nr:uncharacterized protein LOC123710581 isoform X2 [Pieris brassicae]XP_045518535.1 uncharacterized protein LOC123710581 isoform X2 [Pieris brassicae]XP_045518536.1 uncharacterized protein LOC123710581 isoform X2 [Pieris brassicae]XP_045518537.1 uncharacterized protein LOC123710581 isoform X2 [Pieris brassicae]XP_045518538.1 uncharacterized protein LOC123710581 isoform X2 [Pieris brassicae]